MAQDGRYCYHEVAQELFCRHLYQRSPKEYHTARRRLADYYQGLLEEIAKQGDKGTDHSTTWLELVLALALQLLLLPDETSHMKATEHLLDAFQQISQEQYAEIVPVLRQVSQEQVNNLANLHAKHIAKRLLHFVEAESGYQVQEKLIAANDVLEKFLDEPASAKLLARLHYNRGQAFSRLGEYQQALQDFDCALELDPGYAMTHTSRGSIYWIFKEYQRALDAYNRALELDPTSASTYDSRGWVFFLLDEYQQALKDFDRVLELDPNFLDAYRGRSHTCRALKEYQRAITLLDHALKRTPESSRLYAYRGWTYWDFGEYQQALKDFDRSIALDSHWTVSHSGRGLTLIRLKEYQQALDAYDRVLELNPNDDTAYWGRGLALSELKQYQQALDALGRAIELRPNDEYAYADRGRIYRELKEYRRSLEEYDRYLKVTLFGSWLAYSQRGYAYLWVKDVRQAKADFTRSWELSQRDIDSGWMSEWCSLCQDSANAEMPRRLEAITLVNTQHYSAYLCRGVALWLRGSLDEALAEMNQAISLQPERPDAYFWKGVICATIGRDEEATAAVENALKVGLPPVLLAPLRWLEQDRPDFFEEYALPLLAQYG